MMNNLEITRIVLADPLTKDIFAGVYACDMLAKYKVTRRPIAFIVNNEDSSKSGQHWILIILCKDDSSIFFDSYGLAPDNNAFPKEFIAFLKRHATSIRYQDNQIQDTLSTYCGHYCIYVLMNLARGQSYKNVLKTFGSDLKENDRLVSCFIKNCIQQIEIRNYEYCIYKQICKPICPY